MKVEVLCDACGHGFLLDESELGASPEQMPCPACGETMSLPAAPPRGSRAGAKTRKPRGRAAAATPAPAAAPAVAAAATAAEIAPLAVAARQDVVCPRCGLHFQPRAPKPGRAAAGRKTILIVEDMDYFLEIARDALSPRFEVKTASTFDEAWSLLAGGGIDLVVLDLNLEGPRSGRSLLEQIKVKPCPILIFTARDESEMYGDEWDELRRLGADDMVLKGMNVQESLLRKACELLDVTFDEEDLG